VLRTARAIGWGLVALAVVAAAVVVAVGGFRARHIAADFDVWVGWATIVAVPLAALGIVLVLWDKISGGAARKTDAAAGGAWRLMPVAKCSPADVRIRAEGEPTAELPRYVPREHDKLLQERLQLARQQGGFLLVKGASAVGKSRSLFEAVREVLGDWQILLPVSPQAVRVAATGGHIRPRTVVWLDDTPRESYITATADGLTCDDIRAILSGRGPVVVVDSIWETRYQALIALPRSSPGSTAHKDPAREARDSLLLAGKPLLVKDHFTDDELRRAEALASGDQRLVSALSDTHFGVTQSLAGARTLVDLYQDAESGHPFAFAVMTAAIDACRLGNQGPFGEQFLHAAALGYLNSRDQTAIVDGHPGSRSDWFSDALAYAIGTETNPGHVSPLIPTLLDGNPAGSVGYSVADYLLQYMLRERSHIKVPATTWEALLKFSDAPVDLARRLLEQGQMDELRQRADAGDERARELLAEWLAQEGQIVELRRRADNDEVARRLLAGWLVQQDRVDEAIDAIQPLADAGDDTARRLLAGWLVQQDRVDEAINAIQPLADAGDDTARRLLAGWLVQQDRVDEAIDAIQPLADAGDDTARRLLAGWLVQQDRVDEAIDAIQPLADAGDDTARRLLAGWLLEAGRLDDLGSRAHAGDDAARSTLARWLHGQGRVAEAITAIEPLADTGDAAASSLLARWLHGQGRVAEAITAIEPLADTGDGAARRLLAGWLSQHGRIGELRRRADAGDEAAKSRLARWLLENDRLDELRQRAEGHDEHAKLLLAAWEFERKGADVLRRRAADGDADARARLARWLYEKDRVDEAITEIRVLADAGVDSARQLLAAWLYERNATGELRYRAGNGDVHAEMQLVSWLLDHAQEEELRQRLRVADDSSRVRLTLRMANWMYERNRADEAFAAVRPLAAGGDENASQLLSIWLKEQHDTTGAQVDTL
jgi:hypothetical protein